jgi:signal recognition particle receptor subunit beta
MALINHAKREINAKIVYYGCEGSGKSTSLQYIYDRIKPSLRGELKSIPTGGGTLLFFDFSPFESLVFGGYRVRFHLYTLPGKVINPAAWKMTLKGADGLIIVADGAPERLTAGRNSVLVLRDLLAAYGLGLHDIPTVLQHNSFSRDKGLSAEEAAAALDLAGTPACQSVVNSGEGVLEALTTLSRMIMSRIGQDDAFRTAGAEPVSTGTDVVDEVRDQTTGCTGNNEAKVPEVPVVHENIDHDPDPRVGQEQILVEVAGDGAVCKAGMVRIPLELTLGGESRRLVVSISIDQA